MTCIVGVNTGSKIITTIDCLTKKQKRRANNMLRMFDKITLCSSAKITGQNCGWCYVYLLNHKVIGFLLFSANPENKSDVIVRASFVNKKYRHRGIRTLLLTHLVNDYTKSEIKTYAQEKYKSYYESLGFVMDKTKTAMPSNYKLSAKALQKHTLAVFVKPIVCASEFVLSVDSSVDMVELEYTK